MSFVEKKLEKETPNERREDQWKKDLIELLEHCENFELRISVLEGNSNEKFRELFKLVDDVKNQPDNPKVERRITTLLDTVKKFNASLETKDAELEKDMKIVKGKIEMVQTTNKNLGTQIQMFLNTQYGAAATVPPHMIQGPGVLPAYVPNAFIGPPLITSNPVQQQYLSCLPQGSHPQKVPTQPFTCTPIPVQKDGISTKVLFYTVKMMIPEDQYSLLVGRAGATINQIREMSGATITVSLKDKTDKLYYEVVINGLVDQINKAKEMIRSVVNPFSEESLESSKQNESSSSDTFQFNFGVQVECEVPGLRNCPCNIHFDQHTNRNMDISKKVQLEESEFGKMVIENVEKSLRLPEEGFKSTKAVLYKGSFLTCEFQIDLSVDEISKLQIQFKDICTATLNDLNQEFPILKEPTSITSHKLLLTFVQSFNQDKTQGVKKLLNRANLKLFAPLFILPKVG